MDDSKTNTLPDPELNPLLNPVLSAHMGRWAEVYFTSPPEKREEAVAELLRELKDGSTENNSTATDLTGAELTRTDLTGTELTPNELADAPAVMRALKPLTIPDVPEEVMPEEVVGKSFAAEPRICSACGHTNSGEQNFCGMCGTPAQVSPEAHAGEKAEAALANLGVPAFLVTDRRNFSGLLDGSNHADVRASHAPLPERGYDHKDDDGRESTSWFRQEYDLPSFAVAPEPVPYRYRLYVGVVLSILLTVLVYMAWRGTQAISGSNTSQPPASKVMPPAPSSPATSSPPAAAHGPTSTPTNTPSQPAAANTTADASANTSTPAPVKPAAEATAPKPRRAAPKPAARVVNKAASPAPVLPEQSGSQDLATAEKYLSGSPGGARNSREASTWLWKAVGKGNANATLVLSDLYLRGDGVPKSCDQARLLLDVAARKGSRAAGDRLRHLQAFGCQ